MTWSCSVNDPRFYWPPREPRDSFFLDFPLFLRRPRSACPCCVFAQPLPPGEPSGPECCGKQQTQIVAINFRLVYGTGSACSPLAELLQQTPLSCLFWGMEQRDPNFTLLTLPFGRLQRDCGLFNFIPTLPPAVTRSKLHRPLYHFI